MAAKELKFTDTTPTSEVNDNYPRVCFAFDCVALYSNRGSGQSAKCGAKRSANTAGAACLCDCSALSKCPAQGVCGPTTANPPGSPSTGGTCADSVAGCTRPVCSSLLWRNKCKRTCGVAPCPALPTIRGEHDLCAAITFREDLPRHELSLAAHATAFKRAVASRVGGAIDEHRVDLGSAATLPPSFPRIPLRVGGFKTSAEATFAGTSLKRAVEDGTFVDIFAMYVKLENKGQILRSTTATLNEQAICPDDEKGLSTGAIAAIVVVAIVLLGCCVAVCCLWWFCWRQEHQEEFKPHEYEDEEEELVELPHAAVKMGGTQASIKADNGSGAHHHAASSVSSARAALVAHRERSGADVAEAALVPGAHRGDAKSGESPADAKTREELSCMSVLQLKHYLKDHNVPNNELRVFTSDELLALIDTKYPHLMQSEGDADVRICVDAHQGSVVSMRTLGDSTGSNV